MERGPQLFEEFRFGGGGDGLNLTFSCTARVVIGRNFERSKRDGVSAVFFTWRVQVDPVDTFDGRSHP